MTRLLRKFLPKKSTEYIYCFKTSKYVNVLTYVLLAIFLFLIIHIFIYQSIFYLKVWIPLFISIIIFYILILRPIAIYIDDDFLEIHALMDVTIIDLDSIESIYALDRNFAKDYLLPVISTLGFFGHIGCYYDMMCHRWLRLKCTSKRDLIVIECSNKQIYVINATDKKNIIQLISKKKVKKTLQLNKK